MAEIEITAELLRQMELEYITTDISVKKLGEKYGIGYRAMRRFAEGDGWTQKRRDYRQSIMDKVVAHAQEQEVGRLQALLDATEKLIDVTVKALEDEDQLYRYVATDNLGNMREKRLNKLDTKALKDLTSVLKDLTGLMRDFYNVPTPAQQESQRIAAKRLELECKRAEQSNNPDTDGVDVVMAPELEEYCG